MAVSCECLARFNLQSLAGGLKRSEAQGGGIHWKPELETVAPSSHCIPSLLPRWRPCGQRLLQGEDQVWSLKKTEQTAWESETSVMAVSGLDKVHCIQACGVMGWQGAESCRPHSHSAGRLPAHMPTLLIINSNTGTHSGKHFYWCCSRRRCLWVSPSQMWEISKDYWGIWVN